MRLFSKIHWPSSSSKKPRKKLMIMSTKNRPSTMRLSQNSGSFSASYDSASAMSAKNAISYGVTRAVNTRHSIMTRSHRFMNPDRGSMLMRTSLQLFFSVFTTNDFANRRSMWSNVISTFCFASTRGLRRFFFFLTTIPSSTSPAR